MMAKRVFLSLVFLAPVLLWPIRSSQGKGTPIVSKKPYGKLAILEQYGKLPLSFEVNRGQADAQVKFLSRGPGYTLFLTNDEAVLSLRSKAKDEASSVSRQLRPSASVSATNAALQMKLLNTNLEAKVTGTDELLGISNYFIGNDPTKWSSNVPTYAKVKYEGIYSGIDLVYYGNHGRLEYDFIVSPDADPRRIQFLIRGAEKISRDRDGNLVLQIGRSEVRWDKPVVYQEKRGARHEIDCQYVIDRGHRVSLAVSGYDSKKPLIIDPVVSYSTYLGGSGSDQSSGIAVDASGNAYVTGITTSTDFPVTLGSIQQSCVFSCNDGDVFITKLNPSGSALIFSTYLGGNNTDQGSGIAVDSSGDVYVDGSTFSGDFPTTPGAFQAACPNQCNSGSVFVTELNPTGSSLVYSTYLGTSDQASALALSLSGSVYIGGSTCSTTFPTTVGAFQTIYGGGGCTGGYGDAFVTELNSTGTALVYSTYLGGNGSDSVFALALDASGDIYAGGSTCSPNFPTTAGAFQINYRGGYCDGGSLGDGFISELNPNGTALVYSTFLGGSSTDFIFGIAIDAVGSAYITGLTYSLDFPVTPGAFQTTCNACNGNSSDGFAAELNPSGSKLVYGTYLGGSGNDDGRAIVVDSLGNAFIVGETFSPDFPVTADAIQPSCGGGCAGNTADAFLTELNASGSGAVFSTFLGGSGFEIARSVARHPSGNLYITGITFSTDFPITVGAFQTTCGAGCSSGVADAFVAKISTGPRYSVCLLYDPTKPVKSGATIPVKLLLCDGNGNDLSSASITVHAISISQISISTSGAVENSGDSNPDNDFRFDATLGSTGGYIFNLKTTGLATGTYSVNFSVTGDSFVYAATFQVK
jgi:hypothetical protein